ncbi:LytR/AlgR family response regulator transcription factor [Luteimonas suaedae]|uniref:LytR/AlgR family response regulator transcription factor n=1 Tax=Luteimonas suaedae TaxID=2605430 RepID=UPI0011EF6FEA|nr:LytTR family DNA-binding domain-containing protein [Luteimonas suaedae]
MNDVPLRVLIVDDEPMARTRLRRMLGAEHGVHIVGECSDGEEASAALASMKPDVVFLDIQMPGMDGFGTLHRASAVWRPHVVFVTAFGEHAVDAFEHGAVDYLLKPYSRERLRVSLDRARAARQRVASGATDHFPERLPVPVAHRLRMVPVQSIDCIVAQLNYVELHVGAERLILRETMAAMESQLDPRHFARIHRSRIVRIAAVTEIETLGSGQYVFRLASGARLGSGPAYRERVRQAFRLRAS